MQYHTTEQVDARQWEQDQQLVIDDMRRRVQHDLAAQNPGSTVTIDTVHHTVQRRGVEAGDTNGAETYLVNLVVEYTVGGQPNTYAA